MMRMASIRLDVTGEQANRLSMLRAAYADACNRLVPIVREHRGWNRVALPRRAYSMLRATTPLASQMCCNAIFSVCKAYKAQKARGRLRKDAPVPAIRFDRASVHFDQRTYRLKGEAVSLTTLSGRLTVPMRLGEHQRRLLASGVPKEAELVFRKGRWLFNLGSRSAKQKLRQVSGKEARRVTHLNHETSKAMVEEAKRLGRAKIVLEDLTHLRSRIKAGTRMRARLHRWAFRRLQRGVEYKAKAAGIAVEYVEPAYTSQTCSNCGRLGTRLRHRFECEHCGLRAHSDVNASRNLARMAETAVSARAPVNPPDVPDVPVDGQPVH